MKEGRYNSYSLLLDRTARKVKQYAQSRFKELGFNITIDQWLIMKNLYEKGELKQNEIAGILDKDNPTVTRIIDLLCNKKLVARNIHPKDRRSFQVSLTKEGIKKVEKLKPQINGIRLKAWEGLTERDFNNLKKTLDTIYHNLS